MHNPAPCCLHSEQIHLVIMEEDDSGDTQLEDDKHQAWLKAPMELRTQTHSPWCLWDGRHLY